MSKPKIEDIVPGGIKATDFWHIGRNDYTCSRCRAEIADSEVPLMLWDNSGENMLIYCEGCLGVSHQGRADVDPDQAPREKRAAPTVG